MKLKEGEARRILRNDRELSKEVIIWDVPQDLLNKINREMYFDTFVSLGKWKNNKKKYVLLSSERKLIYLEKEIVKLLWEVVK